MENIDISFEGHFSIEPSLNERQITILTKFHKTLHGGPKYESFQVGFKFSPHCPWKPIDSGNGVIWSKQINTSGGEFFAWLKYLIKYYLKPWKCHLYGSVRYRSVELCKTGKIKHGPYFGLITSIDNDLQVRTARKNIFNFIG